MIKYVAAYFVLISFITVAVTVYDKKAAKKYPRRRIRESTLLLLAAAGGGVAELLTMYKIRHKTKHKKFTVGLPVIIVLQVAIVFAVVFHSDIL